MKTAFVTTYDARDVRHWSGLGYFIAQALTKAGLELDYIGPLDVAPLTTLVLKAKGLWYNRIRRVRYFRAHDGILARRFARLVDAQLASRPGVEVVFSPGVIPVAFMQDRRPLAMWSDATHARVFNYYAEYSGLCAENRRDGNRIEQTALDRAAAAMFCSDWAAGSARSDYGAPAGRVHMIPFGANVEHAPDADDVDWFIHDRPAGKCRLLFIGVDWMRKGGPLAVEVAEKLNAAGLPAELTVAGCDPYPKNGSPPFVKLEGFLSKNHPAGRQRLRTLLAEHHFLILPSEAECYGLVYCEANCFGMPCLARRTGGVPTIIHDGENGQLFPVDAGADAYVTFVQKIFQNYPRYLAMARHARRHFVERLNWDVAGRRAADVLRASRNTNPMRA
ncbi:MAG: glycosyltransferase family 4 protein [Opitutaceae bacterium]